MTGRLLVRNADIVDGAGGKPFCGDMLAEGGKIAAVGGTIDPPEGTRVLDAAGFCLAPGFVDAHRHSDLQAFSPDFGAAELLQGITSCVCGNCGMSAAPCPTGREAELYGYLEPCLGKPADASGFPSFLEYARKLRAAHLPLNMGALVGNGTVRIAVKGFDPSPMTAREMDAAKGYISEAMDSGALGLSLGLMYSPECHYSADELTELATAAARRGGILTAHIRGEGNSLAASISEVIAIAGRAGIPLNISHFKAAGRSNWGGTLDKAIELIERARGRGMDVTCDAYPYCAGSTMLLTVLPPAFLSGGVAAMLKTLRSREGRARLAAEFQREHAGWDNLAMDLGWDRVVVSSAERPENTECIGKSIRQIAIERHMDEIDCLCDVLVSEEGRAGMVMHSMSPEDVERVLGLPWCSLISDSIYPPSGNPHPRLYGAFPRFIREFVLEKRSLRMEEAVRKMTSQPARRMGLKGRGLVRPGYAADFLIFRPEEFGDAATYDDPKQTARGMRHVFIGGNEAVRDGRIQGKYGTFLEREALS